MQFRNVQDVTEWGLCIGCGACAYICPSNITLVNVLNDGIRPKLAKSSCELCDSCLKVCPGINVVHQADLDSSDYVPDMFKSWGPVLEVWEGFAADPELRRAGSSGGLASAISLYCIEQDGMHGLLHIGQDKKTPLKNETALSTSRAEILARAGSRYAPASPCDGLAMIETAPAPCTFIGKPCDIAAVQSARSVNHNLDKQIGVTIGIFCAGTPSSQGTLDLLKHQGIEPETVKEIRYRGNGWPGQFTAQTKESAVPLEIMSYMDSWEFLQKYRPYRCHLCPDATSEFADIACGDPWYRKIEEGEQGHSLVIVRTERGKEVLRNAIQAGYVVLRKADPSILERSQREVLRKRGAVWGRILAMKLFGIPTPRFEGFSLFKNWLYLSFKDQVKSIAGTARRILLRGYYKRKKTNFSNAL